MYTGYKERLYAGVFIFIKQLIEFRNIVQSLETRYYENETRHVFRTYAMFVYYAHRIAHVFRYNVFRYTYNETCHRFARNIWRY